MGNTFDDTWLALSEIWQFIECLLSGHVGATVSISIITCVLRGNLYAPSGIVARLAGNCRLFCISYFYQTRSSTHPHLLHVAQFPCSRNSKILPVPFVSCQRPQSPHEADCSATDRQLTRVCVRRLQHICRSSKTKTAGRHGNCASNTAALSQRNRGGGHDCAPHSN